ncbi:hypothetical protein BP5796_12704 [Coleophoma crateriformis]|uniref:NAD(P)-binding protein n=1 Tax=Coleophoma crateriformis TaxID=565419 RepID=A0A3D8Q766_9HELO|nr:hypothetical protein BP5796_12704 [Coleophoma crateriformis]
MGKKFPFNPERDIPDLSGKVILVTGGNAGLGKESILQLAKHNPQTIYMGARSAEKATEAIKSIRETVPKANIKFLEVDLSSLKSVQKAAKTFIAESDRLDILLNNAGLMGVPPGLTADGYEIQFGTNHMGSALLTRLLLPTLESTTRLPGADVRIVNLSSKLFKYGPKGGLLLSQVKTPLANISGTARYGQSKLANLYFAQGLAKRYPNIKSTAIHPGIVRTGITNNTVNEYPYLAWILNILLALVLTTVEKGAVPQLFAATANPKDVKSGSFYFPGVREFVGNALMDNEKLADELWEYTERELIEHGC